jgi:predicted RNA-binding protein
VKKAMCEFNIILDGQKVFSDVIYAKVEGNTVTVKNIIGDSNEYKNVKVTEIDVTIARLVLETVKT